MSPTDILTALLLAALLLLQHRGNELGRRRRLELEAEADARSIELADQVAVIGRLRGRLADTRRELDESRSSAIAALGRRTVIVHTRGDGPSLRGVLMEAHPDDTLVLEHVTHLASGEPLETGACLIPGPQVLMVETFEPGLVA